MGLFDSVPDHLPRWCYTAAGALVSTVYSGQDAVEEPPSSKKDIGWVGPGGGVNEKPPFNWFNWFQSVTYHWLGYFDGTFGSHFIQDFVAADAGATDCEVSVVGGGFDVDVEAGKVWSAGRFYEHDADTLTLSAWGGAGNDRIDVIYADSTGYAVLEGTPGASPTAPSLSAGQVGLAEILVDSGLTLDPADATDRRRFGVFRMDNLLANARLRGGDKSGGYLVDVDTSDTTASADGTIWIDPDAARWDATLTEAVSAWAVAMRPHTDIFDQIGTGTHEWEDSSGLIVITTDSTTAAGKSKTWRFSTTLDLPNGAVVTAVRATGEIANSDDDITVTLTRYTKASGAGGVMGTDAATGSTGVVTAEDTSINSATVDNDLYTYVVEISATAANTGSSRTIDLYGAEVEFERDNIVTNF